MKTFLAYLRLLYPPAFKRLLAKIDHDAYYRGWDQGFNRGHLRGFESLRARTKNGGRYSYEKPKDTDRPQ